MCRRYSSIGERADVGAVDEDRAFADVVEPADQVDQRALARSAGPDQADHFARLDRQVDVFEHRPGAVVEADVAQFDLALQLAGVDRAGRLGHARHAVEDLEDRAGLLAAAAAWPRPSGSSNPAACRSGRCRAKKAGQHADRDVVVEHTHYAPTGPDHQQARLRSAA